MPYEVTATRKRPQIFEQLAGQEFVSATLEKSLETGRIAHAYLFSGPRGCGKTSTARILAKALNCERGPTAHPCGECASCKAIAAGSSLDVIEIDGASNTSVENVRQIKDEVLFPPNAGRYKIYIIDEVHMLSTSAFNALLKTIEEPPPYVVFIFATTEQHKVPATIKSRCQQFTFRLVPSDVIVKLLASAAQETGIEAEDEALLWIARESGGSVRDAYTLFDQIVSFSEGGITARLIKEKLGLVGQDQMNSLFGTFVRGDTAGALASLDAILSGGVSPEQFVVDIVEFCRALLLIKNGVTKESLLGAPLASFDASISEALSVEQLEQLLSVFLTAYRTLKESIDPRYELELAVAKSSHITEYVAPSELANAVEALRRHVARAPISAGDGREARPRRATGPAAPEPSAVTAAPDSAARQTMPAAAAARIAPTAPGVVSAASLAAVTETPAAQTAAAQTSATGRFNPQNLDELKKTVVAEIRKNNIMLATTIDKSRDWHIADSVLWLTVGTKMEFDLVKRFLGIIAEVVARQMGAPQKLDVLIANAHGGEPVPGRQDIMPGSEHLPREEASERGPEAIFRNSPGTVAPNSGPERLDKSAASEKLSGAAGLVVPNHFSESWVADGKGSAEPLRAAGRPEAHDMSGSRFAASDPNPDRSALSAKEARVVTAVEKCFKGGLVGISAAEGGSGRASGDVMGDTDTSGDGSPRAGAPGASGLYAYRENEEGLAEEDSYNER